LIKETSLVAIIAVFYGKEFCDKYTMT